MLLVTQLTLARKVRLAPLHGRLYPRGRPTQAASPVAGVWAIVEESVPDAVFLVNGMPSPLVDELVKNADYVLVPLPYATALHFDNRRDHAPARRRLESSRGQAVIIPAYTYGIRPAVPLQDCPTIGLRLVLLAHKDTSTTAIVRLLRALDHSAAHHDHVAVNGAGALAVKKRSIVD